MNKPILQFRDLQELCQPGKRPRLATVIRWASECGIRFLYDGSGGIWTTMDALNEALGLVGATPHLEPYDPNDF
ncbi:hypothetical protein ACUDCE_19460 [Stenotrophomonas pavanii]|uniref:hypothetical protein n=1 Tax=Stenotrophomonas pavanii TaxID=487698 RepID=UPI0006C31A3B|nr:hypothetical protein VO93_18185 [Stenotrophomonas maltophilia]MBN5175617.1 hypothetical protein [Stenotrophomonas maltophilia]